MATNIEYSIDAEIEISEPKKYKVLLLNDDYSTMEFVVEILMKIFRKNIDESNAIMMNVHLP